MTLFNKNDVFKIILKDIDNQLKAVLKDFHYLNKEQHISKDALIAFEDIRTNLLDYKHKLNK
jgi:Holliday junction resolvase RusA-like endonuclease